MKSKSTQKDNDSIFSVEDFYQKASDILNQRFSKQYLIVACSINQLSKINELYGYDAKNQTVDVVFSELGKKLVKNTLFCNFGFSQFLIFSEYDLDFLDRFRGIKKFDCTDLGIKFPVTISCGMYIIQENDFDIKEMVNNSFLALDKAEVSDLKNTSFLFTDSQKKLNSENKIKLENFSEALNNNSISLYFQPQFNITNMELYGAEVLARWNVDNKTVLCPAEFLSLLEVSGYIYELDKYILKNVFSILKGWSSNEMEYIQITVNLSRTTILSEDFCAFLNQLQNEYSIPAKYVCFDISVSIFKSNDDKIVERINYLKKMGFKICGDDFYSDYSSLVLIKDIILDYLKIDFSFLKNAGNIEQHGKLIDEVVRICEETNIIAIAECVESEYQSDFVKGVNCQYVQGDLYCGPLCLEDFSGYVANYSSKINVPEKKEPSILNIDKLVNPNSYENMIFEVLNGPAAVMEYDSFYQKLHLLKCNKKLLQELKININASMEEVFKQFNEVFTGDSYNQFVNAIKESVISSKFVSCITKHLFGPEKKELWIKSSLISVGKNEGKDVVYILFEDITKEKKNELKIFENNSQLELLLNNTMVGVSLFQVKLDAKNVFDSIHMKVLKTNKTFDEISGYSPEEISNWTSREMLALVSPMDRPAFFTKLLKAHLTGYKKPVVHVYKARHTSGGFMKVKIILTGVKQPDDSYLIFSTYIVLDEKLERIKSEKTLSDFTMDEKLIKSLKF